MPPRPILQSTPISLSVSNTVYLILYGTGIRNLSSLANVIVNINGTVVPALFAGPQSNYERARPRLTSRCRSA